MSGKIQVLVGMIASGKSTYCNSAAKYGVLCVTDDSIVNMLHANNYDQYNKDLKILYKSIENHIISHAILLNKIVIIDRGLNVGLRGRQRYLSLAKSFDCEIEAIVFPNEGPEVHAKRRFESDNRGLSYDRWLYCAKCHNGMWKEPTIKDGFSKINKTTFEETKLGRVFL